MTQTPITADPVLLLRTCAQEFGKVKASNSPRSRKAASLMQLCHDTADALAAQPREGTPHTGALESAFADGARWFKSTVGVEGVTLSIEAAASCYAHSATEYLRDTGKR